MTMGVPARWGSNGDDGDSDTCCCADADPSVETLTGAGEALCGTALRAKAEVTVAGAPPPPPACSSLRDLGSLRLGAPVCMRATMGRTADAAECAAVAGGGSVPPPTSCRLQPDCPVLWLTKYGRLYSGCIFSTMMGLPSCAVFAMFVFVNAAASAAPMLCMTLSTSTWLRLRQGLVARHTSWKLAAQQGQRRKSGGVRQPLFLSCQDLQSIHDPLFNNCLTHTLATMLAVTAHWTWLSNNLLTAAQ